MEKSNRRAFRIFETRADEEYRRLMSDALSLEPSESATYPDLVATSYPLSGETAHRFRNGRGSGINRVINIDYIGMAASSLLDKDKIYTPNSHFDKLAELIASLDRLNKDGVALRIRLLLQYPYSLAGQNRILAELWDDRSFMKEAKSDRNEATPAQALVDKDIEFSMSVRNQQDCLLNLRGLRAALDPEGPNRIDVRFASISTLICGLRVNKLFFYDAYHYGRLKSERTCAMNSTPVIMIDGSDGNDAYEAFCNHFRYIWECDSTLDYEDVVEHSRGLHTVRIRRPENLRASTKVERLRSTTGAARNDVDWEQRASQFLQVVNNICPIIPPVDAPEVGFLAAPWAQKRAGGADLCEPASRLEEFFQRAFENVPTSSSRPCAASWGRASAARSSA
jgi:hypothetical protein